MISPVQTSIPQADGSDRYVIIEPILEKDGEQDWSSTGLFKIYKDVFGDETHLFMEPPEVSEVNSLPDEQNPDYLGKFVFKNGSVQHFDGQVLSLAEQAYLAVFIQTYQQQDI